MSRTNQGPNLVFGPGTGRQPIPLAHGRMVIGRAPDSDIRLHDDFVSRTHAALRIQDSGVWIEDLNSSGGTFVNSERIKQTRQIRNGDRITLGAMDLWLVGGETGDATAPSPAVSDPLVRYDINSQSAGMINNVGRDQHLSYVQHVQQQRESFSRDIAATKTKARWLVWLGVFVTVAGFVIYGAVFSRTASGMTEVIRSGDFESWFTDFFGPPILGVPAGIWGIGLAGLGQLLIIIGIVLHIVATARRRRMERELPLPPLATPTHWRG